MLETIRGYGSRRNAGAARRRPTDPLVKTIVMDVFITTTGFLMVVVAVLLTVQGLSLSWQTEEEQVMFDTIRSNGSERNVGETCPSRPRDPLLKTVKTIVMDLFATTGFFILAIAVLLTMQSLSPNWCEHHPWSP
jgi:hypothetical protein